MRSDAKGFVFGLSLGVAVVTGFGASQLTSGHEGRYVLETAGTGTGGFRTYMTDITNGTTWELVGQNFQRVGSPKAE